MSFVPTDIDGCVLWLDASQESFNDDDAVGTWTDRSGEGNHATQATASVKPTFKTNILNGLPVLRFDGGDRLENTSAGVLTEEFTYFVVAKFSDTGVQVLLDITYETGTNGRMLFWDNVMKFQVQGNPASYAFSDTTNFHYFTGKHAVTARTIYEDGVSKNTSETDIDGTDPTRYSIGANPVDWYNLIGDIAEIIVYDTALGDSDREAVESYLNTKYFVEAGNPYYAYARHLATLRGE